MADLKNIVLVDDHILVRNGLKELIEKVGPYKISAEFNSGVELIDSIPFHFPADLIILDMNMPHMSGDEVVVTLKQKKIEIPILVLTLDCEENVIINLFRNGVRGFLKKDCSADDFKIAIHSIFQFGYHHNEFLALSLQNDTTKSAKNQDDEIVAQLTEREKEFLKLVCSEEEYTYEQIAGIMHVQPRTVDGYRESIFSKFSIKSKTGLVLFVLKYKLLDKL